MTDVALEDLRPRAFQIAYRMLGSVADAEDVVQESLLRLHRVLESGEAIEVPAAYLATVVTRLAIDRLRAAKAGRESYVGPWLPEPLVADSVVATADPAASAEMSDSLSLAFLLLLERLSPEQRAVFLLREVFEYDYPAIAQIVGKSEAACRQLAVRARRHLSDERPRFEATEPAQTELAQRFLAAARAGDLAGLESMLAHDVTIHADGGGKVPAASRPPVGRHLVARTILRYLDMARAHDDFTLEPAMVNRQPGGVGVAGQRVVFVLAFDIVDGEVQKIRSVANPDKLTHLRVLA